MKGRVREKGRVWVEFQNGQTLVKKPEDTAFRVRGCGVLACASGMSKEAGGEMENIGRQIWGGADGKPT